MNNDSKWISIEDQKPPIGEVLAWVNGAYKIFHVWTGDYNFPVVTHWQHLPGPPPKPDPFEEWWKSQLSKVRFNSGEEACDRIATGHMVYKEDARFIWNEARSISQNK